MIRLTAALFIFTFAAAAQNVVPFASRDNVIELAIQNTSEMTQKNVTVKVEEKPTWLIFTSSQQILSELGGTAEKTAAFKFSVDKSAPVGRDHVLNFRVSTPSGQCWTKEIRISVAPPEKFELNQNFPNPFNPTTTMSYELSADSRVTLRVFDLLGREVVTLVDDDRPAGYHQQAWNASRYSSGMYVYELVALSGKEKTVLRKTMLLVK